MLLAKDDSEKLKDELKQLRTENKALLSIVLDIRDYCNDNFEKDVVITEIYRTKEMQDKYYKGKTNRTGVSYSKKPWKSPHQFWHGIDLSVKEYNDENIDEVNEYVNDKYNADNYYKKTIICHDVGLGKHWHLQFVAH